MTERILIKEWKNLLPIDNEENIIIDNIRIALKNILISEKDWTLVIGDLEYINNDSTLIDIKNIINSDNELLNFIIKNWNIKLYNKYLNKKFLITWYVSRKTIFKDISFIWLELYNGNQVQIVVNDKDLLKEINKWDFIKTTVSLDNTNKLWNDIDIKLHNVQNFYRSECKKFKEEVPENTIDKFRHRHVDLRLDGKRYMLLRNDLIKYSHEFFNMYWFVNIDSPKIIWQSIEWPVTAFEIDFYGKKWYLAISDILSHYVAMGGGFNRVYEIGPNFRQNPSNKRPVNSEYSCLTFHWIEFTIEDIIKYLNNLITYIAQKLKEKYWDDIIKIKDYHQIQKIEYIDLVKLLNQEWLNFDFWQTHVFPRSASSIIEKTFGDLVWILNQPSDAKPFYLKDKESVEGVKTVNDCELWNPRLSSIWHWWERVIDSNTIKDKLIRKGLHIENFSSLIKVIENGVPAFGWIWIWVERLLSLLLGEEDVRKFRFLLRNSKILD